MEHLRTLVLNSTFEPLQFTSARRAFLLSLAGKAEALEYDGFFVRTDDHTCQYCGGRHTELTIDHVVPRSQDGVSAWENVVTACRRCNLKKGSRTLTEAGMRLLRPPSKPEYLLFNFAPRNAPPSHLESWAKYMARRS
ncbi:MAG: HNH endonuclease [Nitrospinae bacterium]|nr:HNH endonuclease [Nitrospinota bacterium]